MKRIGIFAKLRSRFNSPADSSTGATSTTATIATIAVRALCVALIFVFAAVAGLPQNTGPVAEGRVVLPVDEYRAFRRAAFPAAAEPAPPPVDATLQSPAH